GYKIVVIIDAHPYGPVWRYVSGQFWSLLLIPVGGPVLFALVIWIYEGFRKPQIDVGNLRDYVTMDILCRPDVAAYEYLATGRLFGKKAPKMWLNESSLSREQKAVLPSGFYGPNGVEPG